MRMGERNSNEPRGENLARSVILLTDLDGGQGRNRTTDTRIFSPLLYLLSYLAMPVRGPRI